MACALSIVQFDKSMSMPACQPSPSVLAFALISLAGDFAKDAAMVDLGLGGAGI